MRRLLTIHAGLPKCGSSALQLALASNKSKLLSEGIFYPDVEDGVIGHMPICNELVEPSTKREPSPMMLAARREFDASGARRMVLSSEGFSIRAHKIGDEGFGRTIDDLDVEIVIFVRRRDEWVRSLYKQSVKSKKRLYDDTLRAFCDAPPNYAKRLQPGRIASGIERLVAVTRAAKVTIISLDAMKKGTPELFGRILDIPLETYDVDGSFAASREKPENALRNRRVIQLQRGEPFNLAFSDIETLFLVACNRLRLSRHADDAVRIALTKADTADIAPNLRILDPELAARLLEEGREDDRLLSERYGVSLPAATPRREEGADYRQTITPDEFDAIKERILRELDGDRAKPAIAAMSLRAAAAA